MKTALVYLTTILLLPLANAAYAGSLAPGGVIFPVGTTSGANPNLAGVVKNDNLVSFEFSFDETPLVNVGGNVQNRVAESNALSTLIFAPRIRDTYNIATKGFEIIGFSVDGFAGWKTDVDYRTDGLGDRGTTSVSRSADGDLLTFRYREPIFISGLAPGPQEESLFPSIVTDATDFDLTGTMTLFGRDVGSDETYTVKIKGIAVPASVPEPSSLAILGSTLGLVGLFRRRRR